MTIVTDAELEKSGIPLKSGIRIFVFPLNVRFFPFRDVTPTPRGGQIIVQGQTDSRGVEISISDTGIGIPKEDLPRIGDRLYRVEKSRSRAGGGTGVGLAIVKQMIELYGGHATAESVEGKGTTMRFWIPLDSEPGMSE